MLRAIPIATLLLCAGPVAAQTLQQTSCALPGGTNATTVSTVDTDVEATFASVSDACNFVATTPLNASQCKTPTSFTIEWRISDVAYASGGTLEIFAAPQDNACATTAVASTAEFYTGTVSALPQSVSTFPGGAGNNGETLAVQNGLSLDTKAIMQAAGCCNAGASAGCDGVMFNLCVVVRDDNLTPSGFYNAYLQFYVDTVPPPAVTGVAVTSGDGLVNASWMADSEGVASYAVNVFNPDGSVKATTTVPAPALSATVNGLSNDVSYTVTVTALDFAGNVSSASTPIAITPRDECDAWECYSGKEKGGFCFITTAAYGSYDDAHVQVFRDFRDRVLLKSALGRALVLAYYERGVAPAVWLARHPQARRVVAVALFPVALSAGIVVRAGALTAALVFALLLGLFVSLRRVAGAALIALLCLSPLRAQAQSEPPPLDDGFGGRNPAMAMDHDFDDDQPSAPDEPSRPRINVAFKLGPYRPNIDSDPGTNGWYAYYFGNSAPAVTGAGRKLFLFGEGDIYLYRGFGLLGVSGGVGYWKADARSRVCTDGSGGATPCSPATLHTSVAGSDHTDFTIVPITLSAVYKLDVFLQRWRVPLVPFLRAGIDCDVWFIQGSGRQSVKPAWMGRKNVQGLGATFGAHLRPGLGIDLKWADFLQVMNGWTAALTFEWNIARIDNFGSHQAWDLSDNTFLAGVEATF